MLGYAVAVGSLGWVFFQAEVVGDRLLKMGDRLESGMKLLGIAGVDQDKPIGKIEPAQHDRPLKTAGELHHDGVTSGLHQGDIGVGEVAGHAPGRAEEFFLDLPPDVGGNGIGGKEPEGDHGGLDDDGNRGGGIGGRDLAPRSPGAGAVAAGAGQQEEQGGNQPGFHGGRKVTGCKWALAWARRRDYLGGFMVLRDKILRAATELYAETGFRGTTTRQIARRAGVNEVTLFRHFGSKTALLHEAIQCACAREERRLLPLIPGEVRVELLAWARAVWAGLWHRRGVIRTALGEIEAHPQLYPKENSATASAGRELASYLRRLRAACRVRASLDVPAATAMLMGTLFTDAMSRDILPFLYRRNPTEAVPEYVDLFLAAIGANAPHSQESR